MDRALTPPSAGRPPSAFATIFHPRRDLPLRQAKSSAPDPAARPASKAKSTRQNERDAG